VLFFANVLGVNLEVFNKTMSFEYGSFLVLYTPPRGAKYQLRAWLGARAMIFVVSWDYRVPNIKSW